MKVQMKIELDFYINKQNEIEVVAPNIIDLYEQGFSQSGKASTFGHKKWSIRKIKRI